MANPNITRFFQNLFTVIIIFITVLFLAIYLFLRSIPRMLHFFRPLTSTQFLKLIDTKNPASHYESALHDEPEECSVCLSAFENGQAIRKVKQCNHGFHKHCLDTWFQHDRPTCPLCRASALPERIVARYRRQRDGEVHLGSKEEMLMLLSTMHQLFFTRSAQHTVPV